MTRTELPPKQRELGWGTQPKKTCPSNTGYPNSGIALGRILGVFRLTPPLSAGMAHPSFAAKSDRKPQSIRADPGDRLIQVLKSDIQRLTFRTARLLVRSDMSVALSGMSIAGY